MESGVSHSQALISLPFVNTLHPFGERVFARPELGKHEIAVFVRLRRLTCCIELVDHSHRGPHHRTVMLVEYCPAHKPVDGLGERPLTGIYPEQRGYSGQDGKISDRFDDETS
jgi:hypothetical protein